MAFDLDALKDELAKDPQKLGYAKLVEVANDQAVADLLNATTGAGVGAVTLTALTKNQALTAVVPIVMAISLGSGGDGTGLPPAFVIALLDRLITLLCAADPSVSVDLAVVTAELTLAQSQGLLSAGQLAAATTRQGSRAEVLFGADFKITAQQVGAAR